MQDNLEKLLKQIRSCTYCQDVLPQGVNPVLAAASDSKILLAGQAPGIRVHKSGIPWNDPSGDRLREWLGVTKNEFYNRHLFAIVPMGLCYPGKNKNGDLPPRKECAQLYFEELFQLMPKVELKIVIGRYAQEYHLRTTDYKSLTESVKNWKTYLPGSIVLPHPSPRNVAWFRKNPWFEKEILPYLKQRIKMIID